MVAISYYSLGILGDLARGVAKLLPWLPEELLVGVMVVPVLLGVYGLLRARMKRMARAPDQPSSSR